MNADQFKEVLDYETQVADRSMKEWFKVQIELLEDAKKKMERYCDRANRAESWGHKADIVTLAVNFLQQNVRCPDNAVVVSSRLARVATLQSIAAED